MLWRDTGKVVRFLGVDGRAAFGVGLVIVHISILTVILAISIIIFFGILERFSYTIPNAFRKVRSVLAGKVRRAVHPRRTRGYRSF